MNDVDIEAKCVELDVPLGIIEVLRPYQPKLMFHNEAHAVSDTTGTALTTIETLHGFGIDPNCRTIVSATIGHDILFDHDLQTIDESDYSTKELRSAEITIDLIGSGFGFKKNELRQIRNNILATTSNAKPRCVEEWITRMSDVRNLEDPYPDFMHSGAKIALESKTMNPDITIDNVIQIWYFIGHHILPQYIETVVPSAIRNIPEIPGSKIWQQRARMNQKRLISEKPEVLKFQLLNLQDELIQ